MRPAVGPLASMMKDVFAVDGSLPPAIAAALAKLANAEEAKRQQQHGAIAARMRLLRQCEAKAGAPSSAQVLDVYPDWRGGLRAARGR